MWKTVSSRVTYIYLICTAEHLHLAQSSSTAALVVLGFELMTGEVGVIFAGDGRVWARRSSAIHFQGE